MASTVLVTLRHIGGRLDGTIVDVVQEDDGDVHLITRELRVDPNYTGPGYGRVEEIEPEK
jgi:hypothetical protein